MLVVLISGCLLPNAVAPEDQSVPSIPEHPAALLAHLNSSWSDRAWWLQVMGPDGEPLLGRDVVPRVAGARIVQGYSELEFIANWTGDATTGYTLGYQIDDSPIRWLDHAPSGRAQRIAIPPEAYEDEASENLRWTFYWEPSSAALHGTGGGAGPGSREFTVRALASG